MAIIMLDKRDFTIKIVNGLMEKYKPDRETKEIEAQLATVQAEIKKLVDLIDVKNRKMNPDFDELMEKIIGG